MQLRGLAQTKFRNPHLCLYLGRHARSCPLRNMALCLSNRRSPLRPQEVRSDRCFGSCEMPKPRACGNTESQTTFISLRIILKDSQSTLQVPRASELATRGFQAHRTPWRSAPSSQTCQTQTFFAPLRCLEEGQGAADDFPPLSWTALVLKPPVARATRLTQTCL